MSRSRILGAFLLCVVLVAAGCGGDKKKEKSVDLPQQVSYLDGAVTFRLPEGWVSMEVPNSGGTDLMIANSQALVDSTQDKDYIANLAGGAFVFGYDPTVTLADSNLGIKEDVTFGELGFFPLSEQEAGETPAEMIQYFYQQGADSVLDDGSETVAVNKAWFNLDKSKIKTFKNGATIRFESAGGLQGVLGAVKVGQNFAMAILVTDKPDQYMDTLEAIMRSVHMTKDPLPTVTPGPTMAPPQIINVTATPSPIPYPTATPLPTLVLVTVLPVPTIVVFPTAIPVETIQPVMPSPTTIVLACSYVVQSGDTLFSIAVSLNVSADDLIAANPSVGDGSQLQVGQPLLIPGCTP